MSITKSTLLATLALFVSLSGSVAWAQVGTGNSVVQPQPNFTPLPAPVNIQHHRSTELGDALDAYANVLDAQGRAARLHSEAAANYQYAESQRLQNLIERERAKLEIERQKLELQSIKYQRQELARQQSINTQARMKPAPVLSRNGQILWTTSLRRDEFKPYREQLEQQVSKFRLAANLNERERMLDEINQSCQEIVEVLDSKPIGMAESSVASCRRFVIRLYDDLQQPAVSLASTALTAR